MNRGSTSRALELDAMRQENKSEDVSDDVVDDVGMGPIMSALKFGLDLITIYAVNTQQYDQTGGTLAFQLQTMTMIWKMMTSSSQMKS